jgi:periplasmic protein TonB
MDALASRPPRRRPWRLRLAVLVSLLIHGAILVLLLVTITRRETEEMLPPPAPVTMLFESGRREGPTLPNPTLQATPSAPPSAEAPPPAQELPLPAPPLPPAEPPRAPPPLPPPPPVETAPPRVEVPAPPRVEVPPPTAEPAPLPPPPPPPAARPAPAPKPPPVQQPARQKAPPKPSDFPAPMDFSFGKPLAPSSAPSAASSSAAVRPRSSPHVPGTIDMSLGPASRGTADPTPYSDSDEGRAGADYRNLLSAWVAQHAYYPEQARRDGEEGDARVHVLAAPDGRVKEVELTGKSGSMWLDLALQALFRDQHIPPYPGGGSEPIEFTFTMHYVLIRPR